MLESTSHVLQVPRSRKVAVKTGGKQKKGVRQVFRGNKQYTRCFVSFITVAVLSCWGGGFCS